MPSFDLDAPQLGEHVWHSFTADGTIPEVALAHRARIEAAVARYLPGFDWSAGRLLEVGAYRHYTAHLLAADRGIEAVVTDIVATSLRDGTTQARANNVTGKAVMVVADYHDFPFSDDCFDIVFVASSVHHTRHPEQVLREMMRVLKPGGILLLANEPCARICCFHAFQTNREGSLTPYEAGLHAKGLLPTLSSPFWGARAEQLFGMVENDRIPLSLYMTELAAQGSMLERKLTPFGLIGPFEKELLRVPGKGPRRREAVTALLRSVVERATDGHGERERLLDYRLPTECDVHLLAGRVCNMLERRPRFAPAAEWEAEMFGSALSAIVRKHGKATGETVPMFRREMAFEEDGLVRERIDAQSVASHLGNGLLPDIHSSASASALAQWFAPDDWQWEREQHGAVSMVNRGPRVRVQVEANATRTILLMRYYAVVRNNQRYRVRVWGAGALLDDQVVVIEESRLMRAWLPAGCAEIVIELCDLDGAVAAPMPQIRVGVFQLFAGR